MVCSEVDCSRKAFLLRDPYAKPLNRDVSALKT
jgi:hypothetical protein